MHFALLMEALGIAPNAAPPRYALDSMLEMLHWFMLVLFVGWGSFYAYTLWRFRAGKHPKANYVGTTSHPADQARGRRPRPRGRAAPRLRRAHLGLPRRSISRHRKRGPCPRRRPAVPVEFPVRGRRRQVRPARRTPRQRLQPARHRPQRPCGQGRSHRHHEMHIPVNTPCIVDVMSKDVIHDFCIPNMRTMEDAIPGAIIPLWFTPSRPAPTTSSAPSSAAAATPSCGHARRRHRRRLQEVVRLHPQERAPGQRPARPAKATSFAASR